MRCGAVALRSTELACRPVARWWMCSMRVVEKDHLGRKWRDHLAVLAVKVESAYVILRTPGRQAADRAHKEAPGIGDYGFW